MISARPSGEGRQTSIAEIGRLLQGHALGPYRLDRFVGGGGMGAVFRALDTTLDRVVAVKVLSRQQSDDEEMLRRFRNEAQSAARLDHENIGRVHAVGLDDGWHYIVFEFIEGTNLRDVVQQEGPFGLARTIDVAIQVAEALEHASQRDVVHRDIKPSNIIITPAGRARVVDMGLARLHQVTGDQDLTVSGVTLGTFDYISPEQARDPRSADVRSDLYSLGCTIFYMLVGRPPFADGTMVQKLLAHQQDPVPAIETLRPDVPRRFGGILARLVEKDPQDRYQRPADLVTELRAFADEFGIELAEPRPAPAPSEIVRQARGSSLPWLLPILGLLAVVVALWLRGARVHTFESPATAPADGVAESATDMTEPSVEPRVWRVAEVPAADDEFGSVAEAVRQAADGDIVEIACLEPRDEGPFVVADKRLTIRAAAGLQPVLRFGDSSLELRDHCGCTVVSGTLELRGVNLRSTLPTASGKLGAIIGLQGNATLVCEQVTFALASDAAADVACVRSRPADGQRQQVRMIKSRVEGATVFLDVSAGPVAASGGQLVGGGRVDVLWFGGRVESPGRFLMAEGSRPADGTGVAITMSLEEGLFSCGGGLVCLADSPTRPLGSSLRALARECRFRTPAGRTLLEQTGVGDPETYLPAIEWSDAGSRYEGEGGFRRIDAAAERVEIDYAAHSQPLAYARRGEDWPSAD